MQQVETLLLLVFRSVMKYSILTPPPTPLVRCFAVTFSHSLLHGSGIEKSSR